MPKTAYINSDNKTPKNQVKGFKVRQLSTRILYNILKHTNNFDQEFTNHVSDNNNELSKPDQAFIREITLTSLRFLAELTEILNSYVDKAKNKDVTKNPAFEVLIIAICQIIYLKSKPHAVIFIAVEQVKKSHKTKHLAGFVNAVLNKIAKEQDKIRSFKLSPEKSLPNWLFFELKKSYDKGINAKISASFKEKPPLYLSIKEGCYEEVLSELNKTHEICEMPNGSLQIIGNNKVEDLALYEKGKFWVQDLSATLPVKLMKNIKSKNILEVGASPGGKTAQLISNGAKLTSIEKSELRSLKIKQNLERLGYQDLLKIVTEDFLQWETNKKFDYILLDCPCSATGIIRRKPEILWRKNSNELIELTKLQYALLSRAKNLIAKDGVIYYCTCSILDMENSDIINNFLQENKKYVIEKFNVDDLKSMSELEGCLTNDGNLQILPYQNLCKKYSNSLMDGFFISKLKMI